MVLPRRAIRDRLMLRLRGEHGDQLAARDLLAAVDDLHADGLSVAGYVGYEVGLALEGIPLPVAPAPTAPPDVDLLVFDAVDLETRQLPRLAAPASSLTGHVLHATARPPADLARQRDGWLQGARQAIAAIHRGAIYQVNLSVEFGVPAPPTLARASLLTTVAAALQIQPVPLAMAFDGMGRRLLSGSMERHLSLDGDRVSSRPIKGTAQRGSGEADSRQRERLLGSAKERAENTMIVDMVRNDLARVCVPGSVQVPQLLHCEPYATLWHLESEVQGRLMSACRLGDLLAATLPPASVTGCPKVAAMKFIARTERRRRGAYCGSLGVALADGRADWSVGIRQLSVRDGEARLSVGSGIVADSVPESEWRETCLKAAGGLAWLDRMGDLLGPIAVRSAHPAGRP